MKAWTHPRSKETVSRDAIERLIQQWQTTPRESVKRMAWDQLHRFGVTLDEIIRHLERRLTRGDELLTETPDDAREERWLQWLSEYESACDARSLIEHTIADDRPHLISERGKNRAGNMAIAGLGSEAA